MIIFALLLAAMGLLSRRILAVLTLFFAALSYPEILCAIRKILAFRRKLVSPVCLLVPIFVVFLLAGNLLRALPPHGFVDPLIVYAVRPDRWLAAGTLSPMVQSKFIGFPILGELLSVWPAAMAASRTEQLVILQLFQATMLAASAFAAVSILRLKNSMAMAGMALILGIPILVSWSSVAKTDMTALYYMSIALSLLFSDVLDGGEGKPAPVAWAAASMAIGVKYTVLPGVVALFLGSLMVSGWRRRLPSCLAIASLVPLSIALRNVIITGNPVYPFLTDLFNAERKWHLSYPDEVQLIRLRPHKPYLESMLALLSTWRAGGLIFLFGLSGLAVQKHIRNVVVIVSIVVVYVVICTLLFNPMPWGAKYATLMLPAIASFGLAGLNSIVNMKKFLLALAIVPVIFLSELPERVQFMHKSSYHLLNEPEFSGTDAPPTIGLHLWANENLPEEAILLSLWRPERYFCNREVIVAQNNPLALSLFSSENDLDEEIEILESLNVNYIYFYAADPLPGDLETNLEILYPDAYSRLFIPLIAIDGYVICYYKMQPNIEVNEQ